VAEGRRDGTGGPGQLTFRQLLAFVAVALPVVVALRFSIATIDLGYLVRAGEITLDQARCCGPTS